MSFLKKSILFSILSLAYINCQAEHWHGIHNKRSLEGSIDKAKFKLEKASMIFPKTDFNTYERPELVTRSYKESDYNNTNNNGKLEILKKFRPGKRRVLYRRNNLNATEIAKQFMKEKYPNIEYIFTNIMDFDESDIASIHMAQSINGVEILNTAINVNIDKLSGGIISSGVSIWNDIEPANNAMSTEQIDLKEAVIIVNENLEISDKTIDPDQLHIEKAFNNRYKVTGVPYSYDGTLMARKIYTGVNPTEAEPIWELTVEIDINLYVICVGINTGNIIQFQDITNHVTYRVVPLNRSHVGNSARVTYTDPYLSLGSRNGWHNDGTYRYQDTRGNNVQVYENGDGDKDLDENTSGVDGGKDMKFEFIYDEEKESIKDNQKAAASNVFYVTNLLHDLYYELGFTEAEGNFQTNNFSGEGIGGDPVIVIINDRSGKNNAQMTTGIDGVPPKLRLYPFTEKESVERDPAFDNQIIIHEYTHGLSQRITGGPGNVKCLMSPESNALNEGWSDFFANAIQFRSDRDRNTELRLFEYVIDGARNFPITSNMRVNPLMYSYLTHDVDEDLDTYGGAEVWSVMLHEIFWNVVENYQSNENFFLKDQQTEESDSSNLLVMKMIIEGMKRQPCNPTFINARDSIFVGLNNYHDNNLKLTCLFWIGFARRGLGKDAVEGYEEDGKIVYKNNVSIPEECEIFRTKSNS
ncbi:hypothetical protein BCR32DRAFT_226207 [Anaeromyces robustus]|uniref:Extracellular metalloproteinase n=1 Tax=Anaeromyces robustus TaxID=1754192 RepID=A0A1Y1VV82_9FUNG|nr:hypothetical protein BCR32DRAFT_226207 [Anaeromyces robustus]|eukprot:ORX65211.1 hypothetical protein BCR32DRAFT_226207 [Anaeromyces robustus]